MVVRKQEYVTISLIALMTTMGLVMITRNFRKSYSISLEPIKHFALSVKAPDPTPRPTPTPSAKPLLNVAQISPNGTHEVQIKETNDQTSISYTKQGEDAVHVLYTLPADENRTPSIPFNTWAPDHRYVFLKLDTEFMVFQVSDTPVDEPLKVVETFSLKYPDLSVVDVTGWAAPNLLIVNTLSAQGEIGPSFWFNVANKSITQLSTLFL